MKSINSEYKLRKEAETYVNIELNSPDKEKLSKIIHHRRTDKKSVGFLIKICSLHCPIFIRGKDYKLTNRQGINKKLVKHSEEPKNDLMSRSCSNYLKKCAKLKTISMKK